MERTADIRFRFRTASQSSSVRSLKAAKAWTPPALFTSTWIVPKRFTTSAVALEMSSALDMSAVRSTRAVLPYMQQQKWGRIINISSESGTQPDAFMPHYNASKAAMNNLTKSLSKTCGTDGILVNTVSPAFITTPLVAEMIATMARGRGVTPQEAQAQFLANNRPHIELRRPGRSEEVAAAVVFLASERASFITGTNLRVDGGSVASL